MNEILRRLKNLFSKSTTVETQLQLIPKKDLSLARIIELMDAEYPIWGYFEVQHRNIYATSNVTPGYLYGYAMYRKEEDFLVKYVMASNGGHLMFRLETIYEYKHSTIANLYGTDFVSATRLYYDADGFTETQPYIAHNITAEELHDYFQNNTSPFIVDYSRYRSVTHEN